MTIELEEAITETLRPRGDGPVDVAALRRAAVQQGRSIRRRRLVAACAGFATVAVVLAVVPFMRSSGGEPNTRIGGPEKDPATGLLLLPPADAPGAAANPAAVGTDPSVLHFDVDLTGTQASGAYWSVDDGVESVRLWTFDFDHFNHEYRLATDPAKLGGSITGIGTQPADTRAVTVGGRPATARFWPDQVSSNKKPDVPTWSVEWQPVGGVWARVALHTFDVTDAVKAAGALVLDRSQRCVAPLKLDPSVTGYTMRSCGVDFGHIFPWTGSDIVVERPDGVRFGIGIGHDSLDDNQPFKPNQLVGDRPAMLTEQDGRISLHIPIAGGINLVVMPFRPGTEGGRAMRAPSGLTPDELVAFASKIIVGPNLTDPATWPTTPLP